MKRAPCINADQSQMQEAHTTPEGVRAIITRPPPEIKEEFMNQALQAIAERYGVRPCRVPEFVPSGLPALDAVTGGIPATERRTPGKPLWRWLWQEGQRCSWTGNAS